MKESILVVITKLETYWAVIEAEIACIDKDIDNCHSFQKRYGQYWESSLDKLNKLKKEKEAWLKDIKLQMELFHMHLESGRELCKKLELIQPLIPQKEELGSIAEESSYAVVSKILAHADPIDTLI